MLLARALESAGFDARLAADGSEALVSISENPPDVVLLDLQMPGLNGAETCQVIRSQADPAMSELPVIMLTAQDDEEAEVRCLESGANDFLAKPVGRAALRARIQTQLRLNSLTLELRAQNRELERWRASQLADLEAAKITQNAIIPLRPPKVSAWDLESHYEPLIQVGGDVFGWRVLPDQRCLLWMADATGHGAAAALVTTLVTHLFQQATQSSDEPARILRDVNTEFFGLFRGKSYMTACCVLLAPNGSIIFSSAGHPPLVVVRADKRAETFPAGATMIGIGNRLATTDTNVQLGAADYLLVYTDGLYSLRSQQGARMSWQAVVDAVTAIDPGEGFLESLIGQMNSNAGPGAFDDDVTIVAARYLRGA